MKPLVSIIIPIYNAAPYLQETLDSIMGSTYRPIEIVMIDDGSKDDSLSIAQAYCLQHPECTVIAQANQGVSVARNNAIRNIRLKLIPLVGIALRFIQLFRITVALLLRHQRLGHSR